MSAKRAFLVLLTFFMPSLFRAPPCNGQQREEEIVQAATSVLDEVMTVPMRQVPASILADAHGIAVIPNVIKGGFIIGARHGSGVLLVRDATGNWQAPVFVSITGGNIGWQIGVQATDLVLVFKTANSVQGILSGTFTIGADAAVAAGPIGRQAAAATDAYLKAEIYSYSRSRGVFAGVSIDGAALRVNHYANAAYYYPAGPNQPAAVPPTALGLVAKVANYSGTAAAPVAVDGWQPTVFKQERTAGESDAVRTQLAQVAPQLYQVLDPQWQEYLALPQEVYAPGQPLPRQALLDSLQRFETVNSDPRYQSLAQQPRFQTAYGLLRRLAGLPEDGAEMLQLPAPPTSTAVQEP